MQTEELLTFIHHIVSSSCKFQKRREALLMFSQQSARRPRQTLQEQPTAEAQRYKEGTRRHAQELSYSTPIYFATISLIMALLCLHTKGKIKIVSL